MIAGVLFYGLIVFILSYSISKRSAACEKGEVATYIALVAWGSLIFGLFVSKMAV